YSLNLSAVAYGHNTFLVVGDKGQILASSDGNSWAIRSRTTRLMNGVCYGSGTYVALSTAYFGTIGGRTVTFGDPDEIYVSTNGADWSRQITRTTNLVSGVAYCNGNFVLHGNAGTLVTSTNGAVWQSRNSGTTNTIDDTAYGSGLYVAVGGGASGNSG